MGAAVPIRDDIPAEELRRGQLATLKALVLRGRRFENVWAAAPGPKGFRFEGMKRSANIFGL